jgi:hypothetical protein
MTTLGSLNGRLDAVELNQRHRQSAENHCGADFLAQPA